MLSSDLSLKELLDDLHVPALGCSSQYQVVYANSTFCAHYALPEADVQGKSFFDIASGMWNTPDIYTKLIIASHTQTPVRLTAIPNTLSPQAKPMTLEVTPFAQGANVLIVISEANPSDLITPLDLQTRISQVQMQLAFEAGQVTVWDYDIAENQLAVGGVLISDYEHHASKIPTTMLEALATIDPSARESLSRAIINATLTGQLGPIEFPASYLTGKIGWIELRGRVYFDERGIPIRAVGVSINITERKLLEEAVSVNAHLVEQIAINAPFMVVVFDLTTLDYLYRNRYTNDFLGISPDQPFALSDAVVWTHPEDRDKVALIIEKLTSMQPGEMIEFEARLKNQAGAYRWMQIRVTPFKMGGDRHPEQVLALAFDVTEHKKAEAEALDYAIEREKAHALERLIQDISHDFRTPLTVSQTAIYLLQRYVEQLLHEVSMQSPTVEKVRHQIELVQENIRQVTELVETLFDVVRLEHLPNLNYRAEDVNALVKWAVESLVERIHRKGLTLHTNYFEEPLPVLVEASEVKHALRRIIENAVQYTPSGGTITIETDRERHLATICVNDTGIGIAEEDLPHIFEPFFRSDRARTRTSGSFGVGLSIARKIISAHSGRIKVSSELGKGSQFQIFIPLDIELDSIPDHS